MTVANENITLSAEQFQELLARYAPAPSKAMGLGKPLAAAGIGCGDGGMGPMAQGVYDFLAAGSPRLALARCLGVPFHPYIINVRAAFGDATVSNVPSVGSDVIAVQDTLIDAMVVRITNLNTPVQTFQTLSDFFLNFQSGIEATLDVQGKPDYPVAPNFTPLSTLADVVTGSSHWPHGWILTYQQQLFMSFKTTFPLGQFPTNVCCTFRGWVPSNDMFVHMKTREAVEQLAAYGVECSPDYMSRVCR
jgi:hypothetical protein